MVIFLIFSLLFKLILYCSFARVLQLSVNLCMSENKLTRKISLFVCLLLLMFCAACREQKLRPAFTVRRWPDMSGIALHSNDVIGQTGSIWISTLQSTLWSWSELNDHHWNAVLVHVETCSVSCSPECRVYVSLVRRMFVRNDLKPTQ